MSAAAIIMMCVALCLVWGGLVVARIPLNRHPHTDEAGDDPVEVPDPGAHRSRTAFPPGRLPPPGWRPGGGERNPVPAPRPPNGLLPPGCRTNATLSPPRGCRTQRLVRVRRIETYLRLRSAQRGGALGRGEVDHMR